MYAILEFTLVSRRTRIWGLYLKIRYFTWLKQHFQAHTFQLSTFLVIQDSYSSIPLVRARIQSPFRKVSTSLEFKLPYINLGKYSVLLSEAKKGRYLVWDYSSNSLSSTNRYRNKSSTNQDHEFQLMSVH